MILAEAEVFPLEYQLLTLESKIKYDAQVTWNILIDKSVQFQPASMSNVSDMINFL